MSVRLQVFKLTISRTIDGNVTSKVIKINDYCYRRALQKAKQKIPKGWTLIKFN